MRLIPSAIHDRAIKSAVGLLLGLSYIFYAAAIPAAHSEDLPTVALLAELSGTNAQNGESCRRGFDLGRAMFPVQGLNFIYGDSKGEAQTGVSEFRSVLEKANLVAAVSTRSQVGMAINPVAKAEKLPFLGMVGHPAFLKSNPYAFRTYPSTSQEGAALAQAALASGVRRIALISLEDEWTVALRDDFAKSYRDMGGQIVSSETILPSELDLGSVIKRLTLPKPEGVLINLAIAQSGIVIRRLREVNFQGPILTNFWGSFPDVVRSAGEENVRGVNYVGINFNQPLFRMEFTKLYPGEEPSPISYACYSAFAAIAQASQEAAKDGTIKLNRENLNRALHEISTLKLLDEALNVHDSEVQYSLTVFPVKPLPLEAR